MALARTPTPPPLPFSEVASVLAANTWGANCGPHSLAAAVGVTLEDIRPSLGNYRGWMNPTMMSHALMLLGVRHRLDNRLKTNELRQGINRLQWEGSWLGPGVPAKAAYHHTHWIAVRNGWIYDTAIRHEWLWEGYWLPATIGVFTSAKASPS